MCPSQQKFPWIRAILEETSPIHRQISAAIVFVAVFCIGERKQRCIIFDLRHKISQITIRKPIARKNAIFFAYCRIVRDEFLEKMIAKVSEVETAFVKITASVL